MMKKKTCLLRYGALLLAVLAVAGCQSEPALESAEPPQTPTFGTVTESIDSGGYTYICINSGNRSYWLAASPLEVQVGDEVEYDGAMLMRDFHSSTLDRTFPAILFVSKAWIRKKVEGAVSRPPSLPSGHPLVPDEQVSGRESGPKPPEAGSIPSLPDGKTVAQIFESKSELAGKRVRVIGKVMKVNSNIMGRNWIHIQDGTSNNEDSDLVVTSDQQASVGTVVVVEGVVAVDQNFQSGYFFPVLLEDSTLAPPLASAHSKEKSEG
jgi:hypothetical protein